MHRTTSKNTIERPARSRRAGGRHRRSTALRVLRYPAIVLTSLLFLALPAAAGYPPPSQFKSIVERALTENPPAFRMFLGAQIYDTAGVEDLVRAGMLERIATGAPAAKCQPAGATFILTPKGANEARRRHWIVADDSLSIPVGTYVFVSARELAQGKLEYWFRLELNDNGRYLLTLGPGKGWDVYFPPVHLTLAEAGKPVSDVEHLYYWPGRGWMLNFSKSMPLTGCK